ncbi:copper resistance CopC/CopD family protein [Nocardia sp. NPDC003999]
MTVLARVLLAGLSAVAAVLLAPSAVASAHAVLVATDPAYGATIPDAPTRVTVRFDEPVTAAGAGVTVSDKDGRRVDTEAVSAADGGRAVVVGVRPELPTGTYLLSWVVLSADGHTVSGSSVFGIRVPPDLTLGDPPRDPIAVTADGVARMLTAVGYLGVVLAVGVPGVTLLVWRAGTRTALVAQLTGIGSATVVAVSLLALAMTPARLTGPDGWADPQVWAQALTSSPGVAAVVRAVAGAALAAGRSRPKVIAVAGAVIVVATAASGHALAGGDRPAALFSTAVHVLAMALWVGAVVLAVAVRRRPDRSALLPRFGRVAIAAVTALALTGVYQSLRSVDPLAALWTTSWGRLLLLKSALALAAAGVVLAARRIVRGRVPQSALRLEFVLLAAVLVVTGVLAGTTPARDAYDPRITVTADLGRARAEVTVDGAGAGEQELTVHLRDASGTPIDASAVTGRLTRTGDASGPIDVPFRRIEPVELGPHYFVSQPVRVALPGYWQLRLTVLLDRTTGYTATVPYRVW